MSAALPSSSSSPPPSAAVPPPPPQQQPPLSLSSSLPMSARTSLYVGDVPVHLPHPEEALSRLFSTVAPVVSVKVCHDASTQRSLGYAYVNFQSASDAEKALDALNYSEIMPGRVIRVMYSLRDPLLRKSGVNNLVVKKLSAQVSAKTLQQSFAVYGRVLSCKVATDAAGKSKGYGFVQFDSSDAAKRALEMDGKVVGEGVVAVVPFLRRSERDALRERTFTNVYVKNLRSSVVDADVRSVFALFGDVTSVYTATHAAHTTKFALVHFAEHSAAVAAIAQLNGVTGSERRDKDDDNKDNKNNKDDDNKENEIKHDDDNKENEMKHNDDIDDKTDDVTATEAKAVVDALPHDTTDAASTPSNGHAAAATATTTSDDTAAAAAAATRAKVAAAARLADAAAALLVCRAMTRSERQRQQRKAATLYQSQGRNLYVKNVPSDMTREQLEALFAPHGTITSSALMRDGNGVFRGFGFVCFASKDSALAAMRQLNGHTLPSSKKPLYVRLAEQKDMRLRLLQQQRRNVLRRRQPTTAPISTMAMYMPVPNDDAYMHTMTMDAAPLSRQQQQQQQLPYTQPSLTSTTLPPPPPLQTTMTMMMPPPSMHLMYTQDGRVGGRGGGGGYYAYNSNNGSHHDYALAGGYVYNGVAPPPPQQPQRPPRARAGLLPLAPPLAPSSSSPPPSSLWLFDQGGLRRPMLPPPPPPPPPPASLMQQQSQRYMPPPPRGSTSRVQQQQTSDTARGAMATGLFAAAPASSSSAQPSLSMRAMSSVAAAANATQPPPASSSLPPPQRGHRVMDASQLATMNPEARKAMLGEMLCTRVQELNAQHAAKITGMLLEMHVGEILEVIEDRHALAAKVDEAMAVLRQHIMAQ